MPNLRNGIAWGVLLAFALPSHGRAQAGFPDRPVRIVVPFAPGGGVDIVARLLAEPMRAALGQPVVVDNRGGANGIIGTDLTAKSPPDGHTFLIIGNGFAINANLYRKLPYDPNDIVGVTQLVATAFVMVVAPKVQASNVKDFIALAKAIGMDVVAWSARGDEAHVRALHARPASKDEILRTAVPCFGTSLGPKHSAFRDLFGAST